MRHALNRLRHRLISVEIMIALHLGTLGDWWAASAVRRLRKLSERFQGDRA